MKPITNENQYETGTRNSYLIIKATLTQGQNQRMAAICNLLQVDEIGGNRWQAIVIH